MDSLLRDLRYAFRSLAHSKGFAAIAILSLTIALGLNTTTYAVLDSFMHPWVPYRDADRLVTVSAEGDTKEVKVSWAERDAMLRDRLAQFSDSVASWKTSLAAVEARDYAGDIYVKDISPNYLAVVDEKPELGRLFGSESGEDVVAIGHDFWLRAFGGVRDLTSLHLNIDGRSYGVGAVLPMDPNHPTFGEQIWRVQPAGEFSRGFFFGFGTSQRVIRLRPGVELRAVQESCNQLAKLLEKRYGVVGTAPFRYRARTWEADPHDLSSFHQAMGASAFAILLIACANLANLMAARGVARRRELALRLAIGARRSILVRQLVIEAALLAGAGGALGVLASLWGVGLVTAAMPQMEYLAIRVPHVNWRLFGFAAMATSLAVVLFGLLPALRASDVDVAEPLKEGAGTTTGRTSRYSLLAIVQVALALVLTMSAALLARSAGRVKSFAFGYDPRGLSQLWVALPRDSQPETAPAFFHRLLDAARNVDGIRSVATISYPATQGGIAISDFVGDTLPMIMLRQYQKVSPNFLSTVGMRVHEGRDFLPGDAEGPGVAIVNDSAARALWPGQSPVGRMIKLGNQQSHASWVRVVGVVGTNIKEFNEIDMNLPSPPEVFVVERSLRKETFVYRTDPGDKAASVRLVRAIREAGGLRQSIFTFPWSQGYDNYLGSVRFATKVFLLLALCGLGLAALGLHGVVSYGVNRRMREFGVRVALGATSDNLRRGVMHDAFVMYLAGTAVGAFAAMSAGHFIDSLLYQVSPTDVTSLVIAEAVLAGAVWFAAVNPARRAANADPMEILRAT